ncbi:Hypothetical predicted protein, partial [Pelobates cultripes]
TWDTVPGMSQRAGDIKYSYINYTSAKQLLKCYGRPGNKQRGFKHVSDQHHTNSNLTVHSYSNPTQHLQRRLRPRTCTACRACINEGKKESVESNAVPVWLPQSYLPSATSKAGKNKQNVQQKSRKPEKSSDSRKLISCHFNGGYSDQYFTSSVSSSSSGYDSRKTEPMENKVCSLPVLPARTLSDLGIQRINPTDMPQTTLFSTEELRKWIIHFGGDEQAAFMARGLQRLQLAYEQGKSEMSKQAESKTHLPISQ